MAYTFDLSIDRWNTSCEKYDMITENGYPRDMIPLWVADMDFAAPECVKGAMRQAVERGIFGYSHCMDRYYDAVTGWFARRYGWQIHRAWVIQTPGVVTALSAAVRVVTEPGDAVLIQPPVYHQFFNVINRNGRQVVENTLRYENGQYTMDFADMEQKIQEHNIKLFILCSPHNPTCRVWSPEELQQVGAICKKYGVTVMSDEIYCDFFSPGYHHTPFALACPDLVDNLIVSTSPSKSFNTAGLQISNIVVPGDDLRARFQTEIGKVGYNNCNYMGLIATQAAYEGGEAWLEACKAYIWENTCYVRDFIQAHIPGIRVIEPQGTYLLWLDCTGLGLDAQGLEDLLLRKAHIWPDIGTKFGEQTGLFIRMALACPRSVLEEAMHRLQKVVSEIKQKNPVLC